MSRFIHKDYIVAAGCYGAVVSDDIEDGKVLVTIRYVRNSSNQIKKLSFNEANDFLKKNKPEYLFYSKALDVQLHAIPIKDIETVLKPIDVIQKLKQLTTKDKIQAAAIAAYDFLLQSGINKSMLGITGSLMLGFHNDNSDIDLVVYEREAFHLLRGFLVEQIQDNSALELTEEMWRESYKRRDCELNFDEYIFHEKRKYNKFCINGVKVDLSLVVQQDEKISEQGPFTKENRMTIQAEVVDDIYIFDLPARYYVEHEDVAEIVCFTATYIGQAFSGETIEASGIVEFDQAGNKRLVIGTSREAKWEYIKVL